MFKRILIPTDGTEFCARAIERGIELAKLSGASIVTMTVTRPLHSGELSMTLPENIAAAVTEQNTRFAREKLLLVERAAGKASVPIEAVTASHDHPWEAIVRTAKERDCDLIVMASHGRRGLSAVLLGSETQKVLTHTDIPVLVVR